MWRPYVPHGPPNLTALSDGGSKPEREEEGNGREEEEKKGGQRRGEKERIKSEGSVRTGRLMCTWSCDGGGICGSRTTGSLGPSEFTDKQNYPHDIIPAQSCT